MLASRERPIVLLPMREGAAVELAGVAPGLDVLGVMLPCTPIQFLLFHEAAGRPAGSAWLQAAQDLLLVMTSANPGGEPLVIANDEALTRLDGIADALLMHDRDIVARCDDSVLRVCARHRRAASAPRRSRAAGGSAALHRVHQRHAAVHSPCARLHAAAGEAAVLRPVGARHRRLAEEHDLRHARRRGLPLAACRRPRQRGHLCCTRRDGRPPLRGARRQTAGRGPRPAPRLLQHPLRARIRCRAIAACARRAAPPRARGGGRGRASRRRPVARPGARRHRPRQRRRAPGAASCCASTARRSSAWATWRRSRCPAATPPRASPGAWLPPRCTASAAPAQIEHALSCHGRPPPPWRRCWRASCAARRPPAWAAGSTPPPALLRVRETSAYEGQAPMLLEALAARGEPCAGVRAERSGPHPARRHARPDAADRAPGRRRRRAARRGAVSPRDRRRACPLGGAGRRIHRPAHGRAGRRLLPERAADATAGAAAGRPSACACSRPARRRPTTAASRSARPGWRSAG